MRTGKKLATGILSMLLYICLFPGIVLAEEQAKPIPCTIRQELSVSECKQGDTLTLTVYLQGRAEGWKLSSLKGVLEYDNSLFTVKPADILPVESGNVSTKSFDASSCEFYVSYDSDITVKNDASVVRLKLHVNEAARTGKTTVCVTNLEWQASDGTGKNEVEHRVPSSLTISKADKPTLAGDVNLDGKITLADAKYIMQYCNGTITLNSKQKKNADFNGDRKINLIDAKLVMKYCNDE